MKKWTYEKILSAVLVVLVILFFYSNTIDNYTKAKVKVAKASEQTLSFDLKATGMIKEKRLKNLFADEERQVEKILVEEGDYVHSDDPLVEFARKDLEEDKVREGLELQKIEAQIKKLEKEKNTLLEEERLQTQLSDLQLAKKKEALTQAEALIKSGIEPADSKTAIQAEIDELVLQKALKALDYKKSLDDIAGAIKLLKVEQSLNQEQLTRIQEDMDTDNRVTADGDYIVRHIQVEEGEWVSKHQAFMELGDINTLTCSVGVKESEGKWFQEGDEVVLIFDDQTSITRLIHKVTYDAYEEMYDIAIGLEKEDQDYLDKKCTIKGTKESTYYEHIIASEAIGEDVQGTFIYRVNEVLTSINNDFILEKVYVDVLAQNGIYVAIEGDITNEDVVVLRSDRPISEGESVVIDE